MGVGPTPLRVIENYRKSFQYYVWIIGNLRKRNFWKKQFLNFAKKWRVPYPLFKCLISYNQSLKILSRDFPGTFQMISQL